MKNRFQLSVRLVCLAMTVAFVAVPAFHTASRAATASVVFFNAVHVSTPTSRDNLQFHYTASWDTSGLQRSRYVDWYINSLWNESISTTVHFTSPVDSSGTESCSPHSMGTGNYYKFLVRVLKLSPYTIYAEDAKTDGDLTQ